MALRFACLTADQSTDLARTAAEDLSKLIKGLPNVPWAFAGTKYFVTHNPAFAANASEWVRLFGALERGDEPTAHAALVALCLPK